MFTSDDWSRRRFLALTAGTAAHSVFRLPAPVFAAQNAIPAPTVITGTVQPLLTGRTARPLRYQPSAGEFLIRNGSEFFNRPLYGPLSSFRIDAGDRPEFSLYLPGHGGNLKVGFTTPAGSTWSADADEITARYRPGRMLYDIRDHRLGSGVFSLELLTAGEGSGLLLKIQGVGVTVPLTVTWAFAGASGRQGRRNGDIGCEVQPVSKFFEVRPEECTGNEYSLNYTRAPGESARPAVHLRSPAGELDLKFPLGSYIDVVDFSSWGGAPNTGDPRPGASPEFPILTGSVQATGQPLYLSVRRSADAGPRPMDAATEFSIRSAQIEAIAAKLQFDTPDPFLNAAAPALAVVADALWDPQQGCVMHGCVAWRVPLAGWRGPYVLDTIGDHERSRRQIRHWLARQNVSPITTSDPATGPADPGTHLARKETLLHSNGDLSNNHYDMNLVFFDMLLRHLRWTGDVGFAKEIWPAFKRHLAWERRLFRRTFRGKDGTELPLYEAYAAIWASDNLQYSGGGTAHASAYNYFSHRSAALLAHLAGEDSKSYDTEADLIHRGMQELLWLPQQGIFAESKDRMGPQTAYSNPALWTIYHTIDSEVPTPKQAWQMAAERLGTIKHVPIDGDGVPANAGYMLPCSDWLPYQWSLNLLALGENAHFALALWQAGMSDEAYQILHGNLLDSMYMGLCPGNFHMTSALDPHRQEAQRDFGDPTGITSRALIEGLFGVQPDLLRNTIRLRPGFPSDWNHASLRHPDLTFSWKRDGLSESYEFASRFPRKVAVTLLCPARTTSLPEVHLKGKRIPCSFDPEAVGQPMLKIELHAASSFKITLNWHGHKPLAVPLPATYALGAAINLPAGIPHTRLDDPQKCLSNGHTIATGFHTVFARMQSVEGTWTLPISFLVEPVTPTFAPVPHLAQNARPDPIDLSTILTHSLTEIFERRYTTPRSDLCTLSVPDTLLGGWASIGEPLRIDDRGLRNTGGTLQTPLGVPFRTPNGTAPNCTFLSYFKPDKTETSIGLSGRAQDLYLLMTGTTLPQCSRMQHGLVTVTYTDLSTTELSLRNPDTWWPIEQDYLLDDFLFVDASPLPPRVDLRTGETRLLTLDTFKGKGGITPNGQATILHLSLDPTRTLASLSVRVDLYNIVIALLAATLIRPA